jgi:hypothetical protein
MPGRQLKFIVLTGPQCIGRLETPEKNKVIIKIAAVSDAVCATETAEPV